MAEAGVAAATPCMSGQQHLAFFAHHAIIFPPHLRCPLAILSGQEYDPLDAFMAEVDAEVAAARPTHKAKPAAELACDEEPDALDYAQVWETAGRQGALDYAQVWEKAGRQGTLGYAQV